MLLPQTRIDLFRHMMASHGQWAPATCHVLVMMKKDDDDDGDAGTCGDDDSAADDG